MEKLTLRQSTILGTVLGKPIMSTVRASPDGLLLPAGEYLLHPPVDNPVYGPVMPIESLPPGAAVDYGGYKIVPPTQSSGIVKTPSATRAPSALKFSPSGKVDSPSIKFDSPAIKFDNPTAMKFSSPSIKFDSAAGGAQPMVITGRPIAGNSFYVTTGLGDLFDVVSRAGGVILVVE
jgi:hypothetical protein